MDLSFQKHIKTYQFFALLILFSILCFTIEPSENNIFWRFPPLIAWFPLWINNTAEYLMFEWFPIQVYDPEIEEFEQKPLLKEVTRTISNGINFLILFLRDILSGGVDTIVAFTSWDWLDKNKWAYWPALPWTVVAGGAAVLGYKLQGKGLAILAGISTVYIAVFGQW